MALLIEPAQSVDLPDIVALLADDELGAAREDPGPAAMPAYEDAFARMADNPDNKVWVARDGAKIVGCFQLTFIPGLSLRATTRAQIEGVRVASAHRGEGIGEQMIGFAINEARTRGARLVQLTTDRSRPDAHRFYERLGFVASHIGYKLKI